MPPALSDESSDNDQPAAPTMRQTDASPDPGDHDSVDDDDMEDEYVVEKILGHRFNKGVLEFDVKWQGYENPIDRTWEPESNMATAADVLKEYFDDIGGRPEPKVAKRKARPDTVKSETATPTSSAKRTKHTNTTKTEALEKPWSPPPGSWEQDISHIDTVELRPDPKTGTDAKYAYIVWNNKRKTQHPLHHLYTKCPQKMLAYYESHLVFTTNDDDDEKGTKAAPFHKRNGL